MLSIVSYFDGSIFGDILKTIKLNKYLLNGTDLLTRSQETMRSKGLLSVGNTYMQFQLFTSSCPLAANGDI